MAGEFVGGAALGTAFSALYNGIKVLIGKNVRYKPLLINIKSTLDTLEPVISQMARSNQQLDCPEKELEALQVHMNVGTELITKCSKLREWNIYQKYKYAHKLLGWDESLQRQLFMLNVQGIRDGKKTAVVVENIEKIMKAKCVVQEQCAERSQAWCAIPELPPLIVGLEAPLNELKTKLLKEDGVPMLVLTAPGGCGKTTLATKFCQDEQVRGRFKDNIFFVTVSKKPSLDLITEQLYRRKGSEVPAFQNEVNAVTWLQTFLKEEGKRPLLLVLDDVWSGSESLLQRFQLHISNIKILVTSRSEFPAFSSPYHLPLLSFDDAMRLFHHSTSLGVKSSHIPTHLSSKIVERCKGFPLAIKVVGRSLCAQPIEMWKRRIIEWSRGSSILDSEIDLLLCLQSSLDALDKGRAIINECYLDLGSFPEDKRIPVNALIDMWAEQYDLDEDALCLANLYELSNRSLATVVDARFVKMEGEGYYGKHYVTQHDLLRELAIYHSKLESVEHRKRLFIDISGDNLPKWWREQKYRSVHARLVSITTDRVLPIKWPNMQLPEAEVLVLNLPKTENYVLPEFVEKMDKLKVLVVLNEGFSCTEVSNLHLLSSLPDLKRIRLESISVPSKTEKPIRFESLQKISLSVCKIGGFISGMVKISDAFPNIEEMNINSCLHVGNLPGELCDLFKLKKLIITEDHYLSALPKEIGNLINLEELRLRSCFSLTKLPDSIRKLKKLYFLDLYNCTSVYELPESIGEMRSLRKLDMRRCISMRKLPRSVLDLEQLEEVICDTLKRDLWAPFLPSLRNRNKDLCIAVVEFVFSPAAATS